MADNRFADIVASDSDDDEFLGFNPVENELGEIDVNDAELDDDDLLEIYNEINREERDPFFEAYDCDLLLNFQTESGPKHIDEDSSPSDIFCNFFDNEVFEYLIIFYHSFMRQTIPVSRQEMTPNMTLGTKYHILHQC